MHVIFDIHVIDFVAKKGRSTTFAYSVIKVLCNMLYSVCILLQ